MVRGVSNNREATTEVELPAADDSDPLPQPQTIILRPPRGEDGAALHRLVAACPPLDPNSLYCNLLQCTHFSDTGVAAERNGELVGFISGYIVPARPDTLFVWQVAVAAAARGEGLAKRMLCELLGRSATTAVRFLETTITPDNQASWALFESLARELGAAHQRHNHFERDRHFGGVHDDEMLMRIGPFETSALSARGPAAARASPAP